MNEEARKKLARAVKSIEAIQKETYRRLSKISEQFTESLRNIANQIGEVLKTLPEDKKQLHDYLSTEGWFLPPNFLEIGSIKRLAQLIEADKKKRSRKLDPKLYKRNNSNYKKRNCRQVSRKSTNY